MKLYEYQEEFLNSNEDHIVLNWCRGAGKNTAVAFYILKHKPKTVGCSPLIFRSLEKALFKMIDAFVSVRIMGNIIEVNHKTGHTSYVYNEQSSGRQYDLAVIDRITTTLVKDLAENCIVLMSENVNSSSFSYVLESLPKEKTKIINVDDKRAFKENAIFPENVINCILNVGLKQYYREFGILEKTKELSFSEFKKDALQSLQKQFLETPASKDTVMTRKTIMDMIKDIRELQ